jgi:hypothetical protein
MMVPSGEGRRTGRLLARLAAEEVVREDTVRLFARGRLAREVLGQLSQAVGYTWGRERSPDGKRGYRLV